MKPRIVLFALTILLLAGCGGTGADTVADVSGFIQDIGGNPVRDARVFVDGGPETHSNSAGSYTLQGVHGSQRTVKATVTQDGLTYYGENVAQLFDGEISQSVNITMIRSNQRATLQGTVRDRNGFLVQGAHVFAAAINGAGVPTVWSSSMVITDAGGRFEITTLLGGQDYKVIASARGFNSDDETVNISAGNTQDLDFTLSNATDPLLSPPQNIEAIAWTTPYEATTRGVGQRAGLEAVKRMIQPKRSTWRQTRDTAGGNFIEVDLDWTPMQDPALIGFEIYRGTGDVPYTSLQPVDFYRDPQASLYEDAQPFFHEFETYTYAATSLNTNAPDTGNSESDFSTRLVAHTLGDLNLNAVTTGPVTFHWQSGSGATDYTVFVFDRFPAIGITSIWSGTTASTSLAYGGPPLTPGHTYYYVVLGQANSNSSRSLSIIDSFVAP